MTIREEIKDIVNNLAQIPAEELGFEQFVEVLTDQILKLLKDKGMVMLADNQKLPYISLEDAALHDASEPWCAGNFTDSLQAFGQKAQQGMWYGNFRKIEELEGK